jgi:tetratricopeptide (TPR) repeat protein
MITVRLLFVPLLLLLASNPARSQTPGAPDYDRLFARALELHQAGDILGAVDTYKAALQLNPDRPEALSNLGAAYVRLGQFDDAIRQYEAAVKLDPTSADVRLNLALAYYKSARPNEAVPQLKRVLASDPGARNAYLLLADCYLQSGEEQEVVTLLKPRASLFDNDLAYAYLLGMALLRTGEIEEGQRHVDRIFGAGESAEAHLLMGIAMLSGSDYPAAKEELRKALQLNPRLPTANALYGRSLLALGEPAAAERAFHAELEGNINDFEANLQLGHIRRNAQKFEEASTYLQRALSIRPKDLTARKLLASLRLQTGRTEEAVSLLEGIAAEAPRLVEAHVQLAIAYTRLKRKEDAERERAIVDRLNAEAQANESDKGSVR